MKSEDLRNLRGQIDALDDQIIALLLTRIDLSNSIMKTKSPGQIVDVEREREIHRRYAERLAGVSTVAKAERVVHAVLGASNLYPESGSLNALARVAYPFGE